MADMFLALVIVCTPLILGWGAHALLIDIRTKRGIDYTLTHWYELHDKTFDEGVLFMTYVIEGKKNFGGDMDDRI